MDLSDIVVSGKAQELIDAYADTIAETVALVRALKVQAEKDGLSPEELEEVLRKQAPNLLELVRL